MNLTEGDRNLPLRFCDRMEHHTAWTGGIVVEECPKKGLVRFRHLSSSTQSWLRVVHWIPLEYRHASILLKDQGGVLHQNSQCLFFRIMKSESYLNNCQTVSGVRFIHSYAKKPRLDTR